MIVDGELKDGDFLPYEADLRRPGDEIPAARESGRLAQTSTELHRRLVELSGNATLAIIAGMAHDISERHTTAAILSQQNVVPKAQYAKLLKSYGRLADLVSARKGAEAEAHGVGRWRTQARRCALATRR